jgi:hypothetical protein
LWSKKPESICRIGNPSASRNEADIEHPGLESAEKAEVGGHDWDGRSIQRIGEVRKRRIERVADANIRNARIAIDNEAE